MADDALCALLRRLYEHHEGSPPMLAYMARHGVDSAGVLTVTDDELAGALALHLRPRIEGRTVVEVGGGIGLLALHLSTTGAAKRVFCIEANPVWASVFPAVLLEHKPRNVSYLFGAASEFEGVVRADVAVIASHSGLESMRAQALRLAPVAIDVYGELIEQAPDKFDRVASRLRRIA